jgi:hypothetical protein
MIRIDPSFGPENFVGLESGRLLSQQSVELNSLLIQLADTFEQPSQSASLLARLVSAPGQPVASGSHLIRTVY